MSQVTDSRSRSGAPRARAAARAEPRRTAQIIDAAAQVFAERGYHGASTQDIADRLGIRQASLYYYFRSKEAALEAVCARGVDGYVERAREIASSGVTPIEKLSALISAHLEPMGDRPHYVRVFVTQRQHLPSASRRRVGARARAYEQIMRSVIEDGQANGTMRSDFAAARMALIVLGACNAATSWPDMLTAKGLRPNVELVDKLMISALATQEAELPHRSRTVTAAKAPGRVPTRGVDRAPLRHSVD